MRPGHLLVLAAAATLHACAPPGDTAPTAIRRDSAGVMIVESFRPAWGDSAHWRVDREPLLDLAESGTGDPHNFFQVRGVMRLSDGSLVVANSGSNEVRKFSANGAFLAAAGGDGEGPGEFSNLLQVELAGDSIVARDVYSRFSLFGPDLEHLRTTRLEGHPANLRHLGPNTLVVQTLLSFSDGYGLLRDPEALVLHDLEGVRIDSIGVTPGSEEYVFELGGMAPLFRRAAFVDTHGARIYTGASDHMQVEELSPMGDTLRIFRIPDFPLTLTPEQVEAERQARLNFQLPSGVESLPPPYVEAVEAMPSPATRPAYTDLLVDATGAVWLRPLRIVGETEGPEHWLVLDADGTWLGSVEIPERFRLMDIGVDEVLGVWTDGLDVAHPQVRRLRRGSGG